MVNPRSPRADDGGCGPTSAFPPRRPAPARLLRHPVTVATATAALLHLLWFFTLANGGGDLAAQDAWAEFAGRHPGSAYNLAWYGGMPTASFRRT